MTLHLYYNVHVNLYISVKNMYPGLYMAVKDPEKMYSFGFLYYRCCNYIHLYEVFTKIIETRFTDIEKIS